MASDDNEQVAWHLQGDDDMYSAEALDRRFLLRHTPSVAVKLEEWWEVVAAHLRAVGKDDTELDKSEYFWIFRKIYRAMIDEYVEEEAETTLAEDWASDSGGRDALSPRQFMDAPSRSARRECTDWAAALAVAALSEARSGCGYPAGAPTSSVAC